MNWNWLKMIIGIDTEPAAEHRYFVIPSPSPLARAFIAALSDHRDWKPDGIVAGHVYWKHVKSNGELEFYHSPRAWSSEEIVISKPSEFTFDERDHGHVLEAYKAMVARRIEALSIPPQSKEPACQTQPQT